MMENFSRGIGQCVLKMICIGCPYSVLFLSQDLKYQQQLGSSWTFTTHSEVIHECKALSWLV